jgi:hypothetical protein
MMTNKTYEPAMNRRQLRGRPELRTVIQVEFLEMIIEDRFNEKTHVTYSELLHELEFGVELPTETLRHII